MKYIKIAHLFTWGLDLCVLLSSYIDVKNDVTTPEDYRKQVGEKMTELEAEAVSFGLTNAANDARRIRTRWIERDKPPAEIDPVLSNLIQSIQEELAAESRHYFFLFGDERSYFEGPHLTEKSRQRFPAADFDIREAGRCIALGRDTAAVFHCMRALETPLRVVAGSLGVQIKNPSWGPIIQDIETATGAIRSQASRGDNTWRSRYQFYSELATDYRYFKDAWRNHVAHESGSKYIPDESREIFAHTVSFLKHVSEANVIDWGSVE